MKALNLNLLIVLLGIFVGVGPLTIDMYLPALPTIASSLQSNSEVVQLSVSTFLVGLCIGMLLYGFTSDKYGRRIMLLIGMGLFVLASVLCFFAQDIMQLLVFRFIQGLGVAAGPVIGRAIVRDVYPMDKMPHVLSFMQVITMLSPLFAPIIGGYLLVFLGWRFLFLWLALAGIICVSIALFYLPETNVHPERHQLKISGAFKSYFVILCERTSFGYLLCLAGLFGGLFTYIAGTPFVYIEYFHIAEDHYGYFFGANVIGIVLFTLINKHYLKKYSLERLIAFEMVLVFIAGVWFLLTPYSQLWFILLPLFLFVGLTGAITPNIMTYLLKTHQKTAGASMALATAMQFAGGFWASSIQSYFFDQTPRTMLYVLSACALLTLLGFGLTQCKKSN